MANNGVVLSQIVNSFAWEYGVLLASDTPKPLLSTVQVSPIIGKITTTASLDVSIGIRFLERIKRAEGRALRFVSMLTVSGAAPRSYGCTARV